MIHVCKRGSPSAQEPLFPGLEDKRLEANRLQFRSTPYSAVRPLLAALDLPGGHWVEPCAGDGGLIRLVAQVLGELGRPLPSMWTAIELRDEAAALRALPKGVLSTSGVLAIRSPLDILQADWCDKGVTVAITNLPWPGYEPIVEALWRLYPRAHVLGLSWVLEPMDRDRPEWFALHHPDWLWLSGRQAFAALGETRPKFLPCPAAWLHWPPDGRNRAEGKSRMLPRLRKESIDL